MLFALRAMNLRPFADSIDQDQTAQNVQSDLGSTLLDKEIFVSYKIYFKMKNFDCSLMVLNNVAFLRYTGGLHLPRDKIQSYPN